MNKISGALHKRLHQWERVAMQANEAAVLYCIQGRHDPAPESIHLRENSPSVIFQVSASQVCCILDPGSGTMAEKVNQRQTRMSSADVLLVNLTFSPDLSGAESIHNCEPT
jgi:hypothetical protein